MIPGSFGQRVSAITRETSGPAAALLDHQGSARRKVYQDFRKRLARSSHTTGDSCIEALMAATGCTGTGSNYDSSNNDFTNNDSNTSYLTHSWKSSSGTTQPQLSARRGNGFLSGDVEGFSNYATDGNFRKFRLGSSSGLILSFLLLVFLQSVSSVAGLQEGLPVELRAQGDDELYGNFDGKHPIANQQLNDILAARAGMFRGPHHVTDGADSLFWPMRGKRDNVKEDPQQLKSLSDSADDASERSFTVQKRNAGPRAPLYRLHDGGNNGGPLMKMTTMLGMERPSTISDWANIGYHPHRNSILEDTERDVQTTFTEEAAAKKHQPVNLANWGSNPYFLGKRNDGTQFWASRGKKNRDNMQYEYEIDILEDGQDGQRPIETYDQHYNGVDHGKESNTRIGGDTKVNDYPEKRGTWFWASRGKRQDDLNSFEKRARQTFPHPSTIREQFLAKYGGNPKFWMSRGRRFWAARGKKSSNPTTIIGDMGDGLNKRSNTELNRLARFINGYPSSWEMVSPRGIYNDRNKKLQTLQLVADILGKPLDKEQRGVHNFWAPRGKKSEIDILGDEPTIGSKYGTAIKDKHDYQTILNGSASEIAADALRDKRGYDRISALAQLRNPNFWASRGRKNFWAARGKRSKETTFDNE